MDLLSLRIRAVPTYLTTSEAEATRPETQGHTAGYRRLGLGFLMTQFWPVGPISSHDGVA